MRRLVFLSSKPSATILKDRERALAAIHLDLDGAAHIFRAHGWTYGGHDDPLFETGLWRALELFEAMKVRATLFAIAEDLDDPRKRELLQEAVRRGHEVASHSLTHRKLTTLTRDEKRREVFESLERIATELGVGVQGFRAPGFEIDQETLELVDLAGYRYDSSLFPGAASARKLEVTEGSKSPYRPLKNRRLMELPMPGYDLLPFPFHPSYSLVLGTWYFRLGLRRFRRGAAPLVMLFHLTDFADPLPPDRLPGWKARLFTLSYMKGAPKRRRCAEMLNLLQNHYRIVDSTELLEWLGTQQDGCGVEAVS